MNQIPTDILWKIIELLAYAIGALMTIGFTVFVFFHKSLLRRLDAIDTDLRPMRTEIAVNQQRLDSHQEDIQDLKKRVSRLEQN